MLELIKQKEQKPEDVKSIRHELLVLIKEQLRKAEGGEGGGIRGLQLFLAPTPEEKHLYEAAIYFDENDRFAEDVQKIADDFAIDLPQNWTLETSFVETIPAETIRSANLPLGLHISTRKQPALNKPTTACIKVLGGEADQKEYTIHSGSGRDLHRPRKIRSYSKGFLPREYHFISSHCK
jgi:hypothetical protein